MSYVVARMVKYKSGNLGGAYRHNERVFENHSNKDIDPERSHLNYELTDRDRSISYDKQIKSMSMTINYLNVLFGKMLYCAMNGLSHLIKLSLKI